MFISNEMLEWSYARVTFFFSLSIIAECFTAATFRFGEFDEYRKKNSPNSLYNNFIYFVSHFPLSNFEIFIFQLE